MFDREVTTELNVRDTPEMIVSAAILSGFTNLFAEKLMLLEGKTLADGGSIEVQKINAEPVFQSVWNTGSGYYGISSSRLNSSSVVSRLTVMRSISSGSLPVS